jgi:hypothetical protein
LSSLNFTKVFKLAYPSYHKMEDKDTCMLWKTMEIGFLRRCRCRKGKANRALHVPNFSGGGIWEK